MILALLLALSVTPSVRPNPATTPGVANPVVTQASIKQTICISGWTKTIRPPSNYTTKLKLQQMAALGYTVPNPLPKVKTKSGKGTRPDITKCVERSSNPQCYEQDHLESLELGGHPTSPLNLWPQPSFGACNAKVKDRLEGELKARVCRGTLSLADAQRVIATDWVKAYNDFVGGLVCP